MPNDNLNKSAVPPIIVVLCFLLKLLFEIGLLLFYILFCPEKCLLIISADAYVEMHFRTLLQR